MGRPLPFPLMLAFLVLASALLVTPVHGALPLRIVSWGDNDVGQVSQTPSGTGFKAIAAGSAHSVALRDDGSIVSWGYVWYGLVSQTPTGTGYRAIAAGGDVSLALRADGSIASWGRDSYGQVSQTPSGTGFTAIAANDEHCLALRADGSIVSWGDDTYGQVSQTPTGTGFTAIAAGWRHSLALRADGSIVGWGSNWYGQSQTPTGTGYRAIAEGNYHSLALRADGSIVSWGLDYYSLVSHTPSGTGFTAIAAGLEHSLALRADGSIVSWGQDLNGQVSQTPTGTGFTAIDAGGTHSLALVRDTASLTIDLEASVSVDGGITWLDADAAPGPYLLIGTPPRFRFNATNTGSYTLPNVTVTDSVLGPIALNTTTLEPGASASNITIGTWTDGAYAATATAAATYDTMTVSDSDSAHYVGIERAVAGLEANVTSGMAPLAVRFTSVSSGRDITGLSWDFGDGGTSTAENPEHTFASPGTYTVNLTVTNPAGSNSTTVTVTATEPVLVANPDDYTTAEDTRLVVDAPGVMGNDTYFGARTVARVAGPSHGTLDLAANGSFTYTPALEFNGTDSFAYTMTAGAYTSDPATVTITVTDFNDPPIAKFTLSPAAPTVPDMVAFTDGSTDADGTIVDWAWTFGDGATSSVRSPTHQFTDPGYYRVNLTVTDDRLARTTRTRMVRVTSTPLPAPVPQAIVSWGSDDYGTVSLAPGGAEYTAIAPGIQYDLALRADGSIASWGWAATPDYYNAYPEYRPPSGTGFTAVASGMYHSLALTANGSIVSWGKDYYGLVSQTPSGTGFTAISAGMWSSVALRDDGSIVGWGRHDSPELYSQYPSLQPPAGVGFVAIAAGVYHNVALRDDGTIACWGPGGSGQLGASGTRYTAITASYDHSLGLRDDGSIDSWGRDDFGEVSQTPNGTGFTAIADSITHSLALRADGSIVSWGDDQYGQVSRTPNGTGFTAIAAGGYHSLALVAPVAPAIGLEANVSVDGGATWFAADTAPGPYLPNGTPPQFGFTATNTGNVALSNITVTDSILGPITLSATTLQPGASATNVTIGRWAAGAYAATATASATYENRTVTASDPTHYVGAERPVAGFTANVTHGTAPLTVAFTDTSTGAPTTWAWTFGDGARSTAQHPEHTYTTAGNYTVNLTVTNAAGSDSEVKAGLITVTPAVLAVPPSALPPTDLNADGKYEDVNGNRAKDFNDIVLYFNQLKWIIANEPVPAFDYNGNGRIDFGDVVWLFNNL